MSNKVIENYLPTQQSLIINLHSLKWKKLQKDCGKNGNDFDLICKKQINQTFCYCVTLNLSYLRILINRSNNKMFY